MLIILILLAVAGALVAIYAIRADSGESSSLKDRGVLSQPMSTPSAPPAARIPKEPGKNPLAMLVQKLLKKK
jgi:hypothetical protein